MLDLALIEIVGIMVVAAAASLLVLRLANIPSIVVYIVVGLVIGTMFDIVPERAFVEDALTGPLETIRLIADLGIALLLFLVGLELSFQRIREVGKVSLVAGLAQVGMTGAGAFAVALATGFSPLTALFIGVALTNSSTVLAVKLLEQKRQMNETHGHIAVGMNLAKDLVLIIVMTFLAAVDPDEAFNLANKAGTLALVFVGLVLMLGVGMIASRHVLARPFQWAARSPQTLLLWSLGWCFAFVIASQAFGLSPAIGAFIAGVSLAQLGCADELRRRVHPLMSFFLAIFFIAIGAQIELTALRVHAGAAIALSIYMLVSVPFLCTWLIGRAGHGQRTSFLAGVSMAQVSELSFVMAAVGLAAGIIDQATLSLIAIIGLVTIVASSYMILHNHGLYQWVQGLGLLRPFNASREPEGEHDADALRNHVIIVGMNALGRRLARELHERGETVVALDTDHAKLEDLPTHTMVGNIDHPAMTEELQLHRARLVISALQIEDTNHLLAYQCKEQGVPVAIHAFDGDVVTELRELEVDYLIDSKADGGRLLEHRLRTMETGPA